MQSRTKLIAVIILLGVVASFAVAAHLKRMTPTEEAYNVKVLESIHSPFYLPQYLAQNLGFFEEENLNVTISATSAEAIRASLIDGRADIVICGLQRIMFNPTEGSPQPRAFAVAAARDGSLLLARTENGGEDFQWTDIKGQTIIGSAHDDSTQIALESVLRNYELPPYRGVTIYFNIPDNLRIAAFHAGTGDYIQLLEPEASLVEAEGFGKVVAAVGPVAGDMAVTAYAAMPENIEANPELFQKFTNAIYKAQLWMSTQSAEKLAEAAAASFPKLDKTVLINSIRRYQSLGIWAANPMITRESYERFHRAAKNAGEIPLDIPFESIVLNDFNQIAMENIIEIPVIREEEQGFLQRFLGRW